MRRFLPFLALAVVLTAGCLTGPMPRPETPAPVPPDVLRDFSWRGVGELGDRYMHLRLDVSEPVTCTLKLHAEGRADEDIEPAQVGHIGPDGTTVAWGVRSAVPSASGGSTTVPPPVEGLTGSAYIQDIAVERPMSRGEHLVFWAATGVVPYPGGAVGFAPGMACDGDVAVTERAVGDAPRMFRETTPEGLMASTGLNAVTQGTLAYEAPGPVLFAFEDHGAIAGTLRLQHADGTEDWDLAGAGAVSDSRDALDGPVRLDVTRAGGPLDVRNTYTGFLTGILTTYGVVEDFPPGLPPAPPGTRFEWSASLSDPEGGDDPAILWDLEIDLARPGSCSAMVDAAGLVPDDHLSVVYGRYAGREAEMTWTSEPVSVGASVPSEGSQPGSSGYDKEPATWGFVAPAGRNHFYWGASGASELEATLLCDTPFTIVGRLQSTLAAFPRNTAFDGARANGGLAVAEAATTYAFPGEGPTLFLWENLRTGAGTLHMEHGGEAATWDLGPAGVSQDVVPNVVGPVDLTMTSASYGAFWYGVLATLVPVDRFPGET